MPSAERTTTEPRAVGSVLLFVALAAATVGAGYEAFYRVIGDTRWLCVTAGLGAVAFTALTVAVNQVRTPLRGRAGQTPAAPRSGTG